MDVAGGGEAAGTGTGGAAGGTGKRVGAVNADLQRGQNVACPARSSEIVIASEQLGQNTRMG